MPKRLIAAFLLYRSFERKSEANKGLAWIKSNQASLNNLHARSSRIPSHLIDRAHYARSQKTFLMACSESPSLDIHQLKTVSWERISQSWQSNALVNLYSGDLIIPAGDFVFRLLGKVNQKNIIHAGWAEICKRSSRSREIGKKCFKMICMMGGWLTHSILKTTLRNPLVSLPPPPS